MTKRTTTAIVLALFLAACGGGAGELYETAQFEELQRNTRHARELYGEILAKYPDSPEAAKAKERLAALDAAGQ
jgi:outer membrane protein assembly factor BamD (BamD/ComL family)